MHIKSTLPLSSPLHLGELQLVGKNVLVLVYVSSTLWFCFVSQSRTRFAKLEPAMMMMMIVLGLFCAKLFAQVRTSLHLRAAAVPPPHTDELLLRAITKSNANTSTNTNVVLCLDPVTGFCSRTFVHGKRSF